MNNKNNKVARGTLRTATQVIAVLAVVLLIFIGCGKKDNEGNVSNKDLIGTWVYESGTIDGKNVEDITINGEKIFSSDNSCPKMKIVFTDKEVFVYSYEKEVIPQPPYPYGKRESGTQCKESVSTDSYVVSGNTIVVKGEREAFSFTISINGNKLNITSIFNSRGSEDAKQFDGKKLIYTFVKI